jgi:hypothetical protein
MDRRQLGPGVLLVYVFAFLADESLRRVVEREVNARLNGYTTRIG